MAYPYETGPVIIKIIFVCQWDQSSINNIIWMQKKKKKNGGFKCLCYLSLFPLLNIHFSIFGTFARRKEMNYTSYGQSHLRITNSVIRIKKKATEIYM